MKKKILFSVGLLIVSIVMMLSLGILVSFKPNKSEAQMEIVESHGSDKIDRHSICRNIVNNGSQDIMVAYRTKGEWCSFIVNRPPNVSISKCENCSEWTNPACGNREYECEEYNVGSCP